MFPVGDVVLVNWHAQTYRTNHAWGCGNVTHLMRKSRFIVDEKVSEAYLISLSWQNSTVQETFNAQNLDIQIPAKWGDMKWENVTVKEIKGMLGHDIPLPLSYSPHKKSFIPLSDAHIAYFGDNATRGCCVVM